MGIKETVGILFVSLIMILAIVFVYAMGRKSTPSTEPTEEGKEALKLQAEQEEQETQKKLMPFLIERIKDHFSFNYILYVGTLYDIIKNELGFYYAYYYKKHLEEINKFLCQELAITLDTTPKGQKFFYTKNKKE